MKRNPSWRCVEFSCEKFSFRHRKLWMVQGVAQNNTASESDMVPLVFGYINTYNAVVT
jgi:hypothetical protein